MSGNDHGTQRRSVAIQLRTRFVGKFHVHPDDRAFQPRPLRFADFARAVAVAAARGPQAARALSGRRRHRDRAQLRSCAVRDAAHARRSGTVVVPAGRAAELARHRHGAGVARAAERAGRVVGARARAVAAACAVPALRAGEAVAQAEAESRFPARDAGVRADGHALTGRVPRRSAALVRQGLPRLAVRAGRDVRERRFGDLHDFAHQAHALCIHLDVDRDRRVAGAHDGRVEAQKIADEHRLLEHERVDRDRRDASVCALARGDRTGNVDLRHDPAAEHVAVDVRVVRLRDDAQRGLLLRKLAGKTAGSGAKRLLRQYNVRKLYEKAGEPAADARVRRRRRSFPHAPISCFRRARAGFDRAPQRLADHPVAAAVPEHLQMARRARARLPDRCEGREPRRAGRDEAHRRPPVLRAADHRARPRRAVGRHRARGRRRAAGRRVCVRAAVDVAVYRAARDPVLEGHRERGAPARAAGIQAPARAVAAVSPGAPDGRHVARHRARHARHPAADFVFAVQHPADARRGRARARLLRGQVRAYYAYVTFAALVTYIVFTVKVTNWRTHFRRTMNELDSRANSRAIDSLINYETVKYFGNEEWEAQRYDENLKRYRKAAIRSQNSLSVLNFGQQAIIGTGLVFILWRATQGVLAGKLTLGDLVLINTFMLQLYIPLNFLGVVYRELKQSLTDMDRMFGLLSAAKEVADLPDARPLAVAGAQVRFEHVNFAYEPARSILHDVTFTIDAGTTTAVVGHSGSGKSTLSRLLFRFYDLDRQAGGAIRIDGQDIRDVTQDSLRASIGIVPQDTVLFNDSIYYNIAYGRPTATRDEVVAAARAAHIHDFIESLPKGYDTPVGERGLKLSGGEKQRVAIARTLLKNPPILLFDEATSALDSRSERAIQHELDQIARHRTTLVIAHRLSTVVHAQQILVMDHGRIVERGTHDELVRADGLYAQMWALQQQRAAAGGEEAEAA
ncbi:hypothetical protein Lal_00009404 [Lupinus albus]|nr:hypothetical protein Lal_00009404 [Lupinus albus]